MRVLFLHPNIPGQFKHLCRAFARNPENTVVFVTRRQDVDIPGIHRVSYELEREPSPTCHRYLIGMERAVLQGQEVWRVCRKLKEVEGFIPDVIVGHPGWGDMLYMKDIYPNAPVLGFFEFFYHSKGADVGFVPDDQPSEDDKARVRTKNLVNLLALDGVDWGVTPTHWQHFQYPEAHRPRISVLHDGIDTQYLGADPNASVTMPDGKVFSRKDEVVTYFARNFEPYRGFPTFMRSAKLLLEQRPQTHIIAVGGDEVSYGKRLPKGETYRGVMQREIQFTPEQQSRLYILPPVQYHALVNIMQVSSAHVYLTFPFVLSWSMLEAMACECLVIGSNTQPVTEVIHHERNGLIADFFSASDVAAKVSMALDRKEEMIPIRQAARQTILDRYALDKLLPMQVSLVEDLAAKRMPPPTDLKLRTLYETLDKKMRAA